MSEEAVGMVLEFLERHEYHEAMLALERESGQRREALPSEL
jgi:hypothetical protein